MLPKGLPADAPLMKRVHDHMFRARVLQLSGDERGMVEQQQAFSLLREGWISTIADEKQMPRLNVYRDQIVWGRIWQEDGRIHLPTACMPVVMS